MDSPSPAERLEARAANHPSLYRAQVLALGVLGYAYIFTIAGLALALTVYVFTVNAAAGGRFAIATVLLLIIVVRALWVKFEPPDGIVITRAMAPALFEALDELRSTLRAPMIHEVRVSDDMNAGVAQVPRLGIFGWPKNYLILGLPVLLALSPEHFRWILAHEYAHLSHAHGRTGAWIYRLRQGWERLAGLLREEGHRAAVFFTRFFAWYAPLFSRYSFVLVRRHEYEADQLAAQISGAPVAVEALVAFRLKSSRCAGEMLGVWEQANDQPEPPGQLFSTTLTTELRAKCEIPGDTLRLMLVEDPDETDTHPGFRARLTAAGGAATVEAAQKSDSWNLPELTETAAEHYLGAALTRLLATRLDDQWKEGVRSRWTNTFERIQRSRAAIVHFDDLAATRPLTLAEAWEGARQSDEGQSREAIIARYRRVLVIDPDHAGANFLLGQLLLEVNDDSGLALIARAMSGDRELVAAGSAMIAEYLTRHGRSDEAVEFERQRAAAMEEEARVAAEREEMKERDNIVAAPLTPEELDLVRHFLEEDADVRRAYVVAKSVSLRADKPARLLAVEPSTSWWRLRAWKADMLLRHRMVRAITPESGITFVVVLNAQNRGWRKKIKKVPGSLIYERTAP